MRDRTPRPLAPPPRDLAKLTYRRGRRFPTAIAWFGAKSFWGHLWHLAASVIATEDIDSRDWMVADDRGDLTKRVVDELGGDGDASSITEALEDDLWIDFVADTGDDSSVSHAVAKLIGDAYAVKDPDGDGELVLPRGKMLLFGGDTAYPVATELEIHNRVTVPWNKALREVHDGARRVLLGIPGNHDWYAGLDGFGRMFRRRRGHVDRVSSLPNDKTDRFGQVGHVLNWIEAFRVGHHIVKRPTLPLEGYAPVQSASYFALRLAPNLDLWGPDRQLKSVDFHQATFFGACREEPRQGVVLVLADPVFAFLEPNPPGVKILEALDMTFDDGLLVLTGDTHHYCRQIEGNGMHVTAGGGGAFLHPARILRTGDVTPPAAEFPGPRTSFELALRIPLAVASGRSGFLPHALVALAYLPTYGVDIAHGHASVVTAALTSMVAFVLFLLIGGWRRDRVVRIGALAAISGAAFGFFPFALQMLADEIPRLYPSGALHVVSVAIPATVAIVIGALIIGSYITCLTLLALEQHQAFAALAHPGYKHFVRLRVKRDGSKIDGFTIGKVDPLRRGERALLVDHFVWKNPAFAGTTSKIPAA